MKRNKVRILIKGIFLGVAFIAGTFFTEKEILAVNVNYDTAAEVIYTQCYNKMVMDTVQGSPLEAEAVDGVDTATGKLSLLRNDLQLEGMAGMDLNLTRFYDSKMANIGKATAEREKNFKTDTIRIAFKNSKGEKHEVVVNTAIYEGHPDALKNMFISYEKVSNWKDTTIDTTQQTKLLQSSNYNVYGISTGWAFDYPWIETMTIGDSTIETPIYLHYGSIGTMRIVTDLNGMITGLDGYDYQDVKLEDFNQTVDGVECRYILRDKMGFRTYFNKDGVIVMQKDNHDNTIKFTYQNTIYFDTITDSVGRKVKFSYTESSHGLPLLQKVTVKGEKITGGVSKRTITYSSSETSYKSIRGEKMYGSKLNSVTIDGTKETYTYSAVESLVNTSGAGVASQRAVTNETYLVQGVEAEGCINKYEYRAGAVRSVSLNSDQARDVVTQHYYVTREYEQSSSNSKKKVNGLKYDYFQKQYNQSSGKTEFVSYDDLDNEQHEMQAYGTDKLQCMTLVSTYNPNKKQKAKKITDYVYNVDDIDSSSLQLKKKPKKATTVYVYNANKLLISETSEGKKKVQTQYFYDKNGAGSLIILETYQNYGTKRTNKALINKKGYMYDSYRNIVEYKRPKAYMEKYKGKEELFTDKYSYIGDTYPKDANTPYNLTLVKSYEGSMSDGTKGKIENIVDENGIDVIRENAFVTKNSNTIKVAQKDYTYNSNGMATQVINYPNCGNGEMGDVEKINYQYNRLGQSIKTEVSKTSERHPEQNVSYVESETTYDEFGNELSQKDSKGIVTFISYDEETGEEISSIKGEGTPYETKDETVTNADESKSMTLDYYNRCVVSFYDEFGNTIISKDEKNGTWTESEYEYGAVSEENEEDDSGNAVEAQLKEERIYSFNPSEEKVFQNKNGEKIYNFDIGGRGSKILSGTRYTYDNDGEEIVIAEFSGGAMDAKHCSHWQLLKTEEEIMNDGSTKIISYEKELNTKNYNQQVNIDNYYNEYDAYILRESITQSISDDQGNVISEKIVEKAANSKLESTKTYTYDMFGRIEKEVAVTRTTIKGKIKNKSENVVDYQYDYLGNVVKLQVKSRKSESEPWVTNIQTAKYNNQGRIIESATGKGVKEGYSTKFEYDISGQLIKQMNPVTKTDKGIEYQICTKEYDLYGNIIAEEEQQNDKNSKRVEYIYDDMNHLVLVKNVVDKSSAIYTQYMYDREGNKIRQFTGLTKPLSLELKEGSGEDSYTYMGHKYYISVSGKAKKDNYSETKYSYNKKNQIVALTDAEENIENYEYDEYDNLIKTIDRNGNEISQEYDYQNRIIRKAATDIETGKSELCNYEYDDYGYVNKVDNSKYTYDVLSGEIISETILGEKKKIQKEYQYDSDGDITNFKVKVGDKTELALCYEYDGASRLKKVINVNASTKELVEEYDYDENGALISSTGSVRESQYSYDLADRLTNLVNKNTRVLSEYNATYQKNGQKIEETEEIQDLNRLSERNTLKYEYDSLGRLIKENNANGTDILYEYDAHNNRTKMSTENSVTSYKYNKNEELVRTDCLNKKTEQNTVTLYKNDKNGNRLAVVNRKKIDKFNTNKKFGLDITIGENQLNENQVSHYNALNQQNLVFAKNYKVKYTYNAVGLRTSKTVNNQKSIYIWDNDQLVMELNDKCEVKKRYIRGKNLIYADSGEGTVKQYYVFDMQGSVVQLLDDNGNVVKKYSYDAFGNEINPDKKDNNPFRYCGEYYDKEIDTLYLRARDYDAESGRFVTRDTYTGVDSDIASLNLYTYCQNDSVNRIDPSGHDSYIFYDKNAKAGNPTFMFEDEADIVYEDFVTRREKCHIYGVKNAAGLVKKWNKYIGKKVKNNKVTNKKVSINEVYMIFHGSISGAKGKATGYMYMVGKKKQPETRLYSRNNSEKTKNDKIVADLKNRHKKKKKKFNINKVTFSSCNTANPDCYNIAQAFIDRMKVRTVVGFDGGAYYDYNDNTLKKGTGSQPTWDKYVKRQNVFYICNLSPAYVSYNRPVRERMGLRTYQNGKWDPVIKKTSIVHI